MFRTTIVKTFHVALDVMFATARYRIACKRFVAWARTILTNSTFMFGSETFIGGPPNRRKKRLAILVCKRAPKNSSSQIGLPASREIDDHCGSGVGAMMSWCDHTPATTGGLHPQLCHSERSGPISFSHSRSRGTSAVYSAYRRPPAFMRNSLP